MAGKVVHFEVPFDDAERVTAFYRDVFGWNVTALPELDYHGVATGPVGEDGMPLEPGFIGGGMFKRQDGAPTTPVITIDVDDIDATLRDVAARGGAVLGEKIPVGDMGTAAYFTDPEGNVMGLWQSA